MSMSLSGLTKVLPDSRSAVTRLSPIWLACLLASLPTSAAETWQLQPSFTVASTFEDNIRLSRLNKEDGVATRLAATLNGRKSAENTLVWGSIGVNHTAYTGNQDSSLVRDRTNFLGEARLRHRLERWTLGGRVRFRREDLLRRFRESQDVIDDGSGIDGGGGLGLIEDLLPDGEETIDSEFTVNAFQVNRLLYQVGTFAQYSLTERNALRIDLRYLERTFSNTTAPEGTSLLGGNTFRDVKRYAIGGRFSRQLSETDQLGINLEASRVEPDGGLEADYYSSTVSFTRALTERTALDTQVGITHIDSDVGGDTGWLASLRWTARTPRALLQLRGSRNIYPSAFGNASERDLLQIDYNYRLARRWSASLLLTGERVDEPNNSVGFDYNRISFRPTLNWRFARSLTAGINYSYRWIDREGDGTSPAFGIATGHAGGLSIRYAPQL